MLKVYPSLLAADPLNLEKDALRVVESGCDALHVDVMDAHFVPNLAFGPAVVRALTGRLRTPADVHLMMDRPETLLDAFLDAGPAILTLHAEAEGDLPAMLGKIRARGVKTGLSLKPGTPAEAAVPFFGLADLILVMTVEPGFGGQSFRTDMLDKIAALRRLGYTGLLEADGGLGRRNLQTCLDHGLDIAVMGTSVFREEQPAELINWVHGLRPSGETQM